MFTKLLCELHHILQLDFLTRGCRIQLILILERKEVKYLQGRARLDTFSYNKYKKLKTSLGTTSKKADKQSEVKEKLKRKVSCYAPKRCTVWNLFSQDQLLLYWQVQFISTNLVLLQSSRARFDNRTSHFKTKGKLLCKGNQQQKSLLFSLSLTLRRRIKQSQSSRSGSSFQILQQR
eukprot:TRINITY_DN6808_c0_g1_i3.p4 TRINITY_DN6808_c0_g1~~TRINITY_DN6808_c0_g1_i3.p4  ORF type:complete len:177 (+),score=3.46 TRINITY_DN6808_c0_g1_i3:40-570(+)